MSENLDRLAQSVVERQAIAAEHATLVAAGRSAHERLSEKLVPMVDDAAFALTLAIEQAADKGQLADVRRTLGTLADNDLVALQTTLELRAEANLLLGVLVEAADLRNREQMPPIKDRFVAAASAMQRDGWWWRHPASTDRTIRRMVLKEIIGERWARVRRAVFDDGQRPA